MARQVQAPIAVNSSAGAFTPITAKTYSRYTEIDEDVPSGSTAQGLQVTWPNGNVVDYTPAQLPIKIATPGGGGGGFVGVPTQATNFPGGVAPAATTYLTARSLTATATKVKVSEDN